ncbi:hypothetical protein R1sor_014593 [Riccia sorocarpa]|uniref:Endonuclease/exonuclease/phosphatase domain-containing protein n=1 Tax=Riccia sorocarpa TaxID=122646 RepID=A0ABD3HDP9_9MARC
MLVDLKIISWNIHGLGSVDRLRVAKRWLVKEQKEVKILALQELKALEENLHFNLGSIWENANVIVDYSLSGRGGAALVLHPMIQVIERGIKGDGTCAWAKILTEKGPINVMSLYAPNNARERRGLWIWLRENLNEENWVITRDWNSVELPDDSDGPTVVLTRGDLRVWKVMTNDFELVDAYICAAFTEGPRFTRQVYCGDRLDQARLDRCYLSNGGSSVQHIHKVSHVATQTLSDHWPVVVTLHLKEEAQEEMRRGTYFKMNSEDLKNAEVFEGVRRIWKEHPDGVCDPQAKWVLAWDRVRKFLKNWRSNMRRKEDPLKQKKQELLAVRMRMQNERDTNLKARIQTLEAEIRKRELSYARCWRICSRVWWMTEGEAPSLYFFAQLKSKHARETIQSLRRENGTETKNEREIQAAVHQYFQKQFRVLPTSDHAVLLRREVLSLVDRRVSQEQNLELVKTPDEEEVDLLVEELPRNKALGLDGVTNNLIQDCYGMTLWKLELLMGKLRNPVPVDWRKLKVLFRKCRIECINDLVDRQGRIRVLPGLEREISADEDAAQQLTRVEGWLRQGPLTDENLEDSNGWTWCGGEVQIPMWTATNKTWKKVLTATGSSDEALYRKWPNGGGELEWRKNSSIPTSEILREVVRELEALGTRRTSESRQASILADIRKILAVIDRTENQEAHDPNLEWTNEEDVPNPDDLEANEDPSSSQQT